jgi:hypothetical protein
VIGRGLWGVIVALYAVSGSHGDGGLKKFTSDPAIMPRVMRIQYNFLRHQMLTSQVTDVNSKASAHEWGLSFS